MEDGDEKKCQNDQRMQKSKRRIPRAVGLLENWCAYLQPELVVSAKSCCLCCALRKKRGADYLVLLWQTAIQSTPLCQQNCLHRGVAGLRLHLFLFRPVALK